MDIREYNSAAWDGYVDDGIEWSIPVSSEEIERARNDDWTVVLTPLKKVPREWFGEIRGEDILCLASGGGQQAPIFAAAGANVISFDNSAKQLEKDKFVAERDNLKIVLEKGDAADLSRFEDGSFDLIFHPCSNCFMENLEPIWRECYRVLRKGGVLLSGMNQPLVYIFDRHAEENEKVLKVRHALPYSDLKSLTPEEQQTMFKKKRPSNSVIRCKRRSADRLKLDLSSLDSMRIRGAKKRVCSINTHRLSWRPRPLNCR